MFNSDTFVEGKTKACKLSEVNYKPFHTLLYRFYGLPLDYGWLDFHNELKAVLGLAHLFQLDIAILEIEEYLLTVNSNEASKWFSDADTFQLTRLTTKIIDNMPLEELKALYKVSKTRKTAPD